MATLGQRRGGRSLFLVCMLGPTLALYVAFFLIPNLWSLYVSFFQWRATSLDKTFIGLQNYRQLAQDRLIWLSLANNLYFMVCIVLIGTSVGLFLAAAVTQERGARLAEREFYRTVFFFPNVLSIVVSSILWVLIYSPAFGLINPALQSLGLGALKRVWLGDPNTVKPALVVFFLWGNIGFNFVVLTSAMQGVPPQYYEAAEIDGAGRVYQFFRITIPLIAGVVRTCVVFAISAIFVGGFATIKIMTEGGPNHASEILTTYMYSMTFGQAKFGYGATIGVLILVVTMGLVLVANRAGRGQTYEY